MTKKKAAAKKTAKVAAKPRKAVAAKPTKTEKYVKATERPVPAVQQEPKKLPKYEGVQVLEVLKDNETATHFHCRMANGTTMHVPKELFN